MRAKFASGLIVAAIVLPVVAQAPNKIMAQSLVEMALASDTNLSALTFHITPPGSNDNIIIASNIATIGKKADADDLSVLQTGKPIAETNKAKTRFGIELPMKASDGRVIGVLAVGYVYKPGDDTSGFLIQAEALRDALAKKILDEASLMKSVP